MLALLAVVVLAATPSIDERIAHAEQQIAALDYDLAADELSIIAADPAATEAQRIRASLLAGIANRIVGREVEARACFRYVLLRAPETRLPPETSPKVNAFFELTRQELDAERSSFAPTAPAAPASAEPPPASPLPFVVAAGGGIALVAGGALAVASEALLADATLTAPQKSTWLVVGRAGLVVAVVGALVGGGALAVGALE